MLQASFEQLTTTVTQKLRSNQKSLYQQLVPILIRNEAIMSIYHLKNLCALNSFKYFKSQQEFISYPESVRTSKDELVGVNLQEMHPWNYPHLMNKLFKDFWEVSFK